MNRYKWQLPVDPSGPPMTYPEPMPTFIPPSMSPPAQAAPPAPAAPTDIAYPPTDFQEPQQATPETNPEDEEFDRQMEEERVEADWTRMTKRATAVLKVEADMQKARNAVAEAHQKATQRPSAEAPNEPLNRVFNRYVKGHAPMPTLEEYKASVRAPTGAEALGWTEEAPELQEFYSAGGTPEELRGIRKEEADKITLEKYAPQYAAPFQDLTFGEGRKLVGRQREHREATMAPIREKIASIRERRKELRRERRAPTGWDIMEHKEEVARIGAGEPAEEAPRYPRGHKLDVINNETMDAQAELEALLEERAELTEIITTEAGWWESDKEEAAKARAAEIDPRITTLQEKITRLQKESREISGLTEIIATATNPETGQKLGFDGKQWRPIQ